MTATFEPVPDPFRVVGTFVVRVGQTSMVVTTMEYADGRKAALLYDLKSAVRSTYSLTRVFSAVLDVLDEWGAEEIKLVIDADRHDQKLRVYGRYGFEPTASTEMIRRAHRGPHH